MSRIEVDRERCASTGGCEAVAPEVFDLARDPNPHVGFGAHGPHFCLGAHLARREIAITFRELFAQLPDLEVTGEPDRPESWSTSVWVNTTVSPRRS